MGEEGVVVRVMRDAFHDFMAFEWWKPERETAAKEIAKWIEVHLNYYCSGGGGRASGPL